MVFFAIDTLLRGSTLLKQGRISYSKTEDAKMIDSISFLIVVNIPTCVFVALALVGNIPGEYGRRALVTYTALLAVLFGTLLGAALQSPLLAYCALVAAFAAAAVSGPWGLLLSAVTLAALAIGSLVLVSSLAAWGPAFAAAVAGVAFIHSRWTGRF